jgi:hypothetical protein
MDLSVSLRLGRWSQMPETKASTGRKREKEKSKRKGRRNPGKAHGRLVWSSLFSSFFLALLSLASAYKGSQSLAVALWCFFFALNLFLCGSAHMRAASLCDRRIPAFFSLVHSAIFAIDCFFSLPFFHFLFFAAPCLCVGVWSAVARRAQKRKKKKAHTGARRR